MAAVDGKRLGSHELLLSHGIEVVDLQRPEVMDAMIEYFAEHPSEGLEDLGTPEAEDTQRDEKGDQCGDGEWRADQVARRRH